MDHQWLAREFREAAAAVVGTRDDPTLASLRVTHVEAGSTAVIRFEGAPVLDAGDHDGAVPVDTTPILDAIARTLERRARRFANGETHGDQGTYWFDGLRAEFPGWFDCGLSVPPGWADLIHAMAERVRALDPPPNFAFTQVKEKFGMLRAYNAGFTDAVAEAVDVYEVASIGICETCGGSGISRRTPGDWYRTACAKHSRGALPLRLVRRD